MIPPAGPPHPLVQIHYHRPPDRLDVFRQRLLSTEAGCLVTFAESIEGAPTMELDGRAVLQTGSDIVWFTFPGAWHDIGRFHTRDGEFTGLYANILTPVEIGTDHVWHTTDLFLDVWLPPGGPPALLDEDQLDEAVASGWIEADTAARARHHAARIMENAASGSWPPRIVAEWTRERARAALRP